MKGPIPTRDPSFPEELPQFGSMRALKGAQLVREKPRLPAMQTARTELGKAIWATT